MDRRTPLLHFSRGSSGYRAGVVPRFGASVCWRLLLIAFFIALFLSLFFSQTANAHAILLRSDPAKLAVLPAAPATIHLWFSEDLNPAFSTAYVIKAAQSRANVQKDSKADVDGNDAHVLATDDKEMDVSLKANLPAGVYLVLYRSQSANDGHIFTGFFLFKVATADGTVPAFNGVLPQQISFGDGEGSSSENNGSSSFDLPTLFSLIMVTLVDLGTIFWVGGQFWLAFILPDDEAEAATQIERRFDRSFSWQILIFLFFANIGVLIGQALSLTSGQWGSALAPSLLISLVAHGGHFGIFWALREIIIILALLLSIYTNIVKNPSSGDSAGDASINRHISNGESDRRDRIGSLPGEKSGIQKSHHISIISRGNFVLLLALLVAVAESGHAAAVRSDLLGYAVFADYLHLVAASLWVGGMLFIALIILPVLSTKPWQQQTTTLLTMLARYSPFAFTGVVLMALSGPFNAGTRMLSWSELVTTAYGYTLIGKTLLVSIMLLISAIHVFRLRPQLVRDFTACQKGANESCPNTNGSEGALASSEGGTSSRASVSQIEWQTRRLTRILRWEPVLGVAVLLCTGLLSAFSGTLQPVGANANLSLVQPTPTFPARPLTVTVITADDQLQAAFHLAPNQVGINTITTTVLNSKGTPLPTSGISVSLAMTLTNLNNDTQTLNLPPDGQGHFQARTNLSTSGEWRILLTIHMPDGKTHEATVEFFLS